MDIIKLQNCIEFLKNNPKIEYNPYPDYAPLILQSLDFLWVDENYRTNYETLEGKDISDMTLDELATMFTFIKRSERFSMGSIAAFVEDGTLLKLLLRLQQLQ